MDRLTIYRLYAKTKTKHFYCDFQAPRPIPGLQAVVSLQSDAESGVTGDLVFTQIVPNGPVTIEGNVTGLAPGLHGVHVHQSGVIKETCKEIGPHFIAYYVSEYL